MIPVLQVYLDGQDNLPLLCLFPNLSSLELQDVELQPLMQFFTRNPGEGRKLRSLSYSSRFRNVCLSSLCQACPSLTSLSLTSSLISATRGPLNFPHLASLSLRDITIQGDQGLWKSLVRSCGQLSRLTLHNVRMSEADLGDVVSATSSLLEEINISASSGTNIPLTEEAVLSLVTKCPKLRRIGGICGWNIGDLPSLLENLVTRHTFRLRLDDQGD